MKTVAFYTLGCKVNQYETQAITELFEKSGYNRVDFSEPSDIYVINTCSVTSMSDRKSRKIIHRAKKTNPGSVVVVTGCYAQTSPENVLNIEGVNLIVGTKDRAKIVELVEKIKPCEKKSSVVSIMDTHTFEELSVNSYTERSRAFIKIQEGCNQFCSYCIIPYARGPIRSRLPEKITEEAKRLAESGFSELVLVGIHIASYGLDLKTTDLADIIGKVNQIEKIKRIRLSSIEPMTLNSEFIAKIKNCNKLCPHFHISLQSGSDSTLKRMNRKYTTARFESIVEGIRSAFCDVSITTDIMVGFPGETDTEFEESYNFAKKMQFSDMHVFSYSPRQGTSAAKMQNQIEPAIKHQRSEKMISLANDMKNSYLKKFIDRSLDVLFEQPANYKKGYFEGKTNNYISVAVKSDTDICGKILPVRLIEIEGGYVLGELTS